MQTMTSQQWHEFVMAGTLTGKLAVTRADGRPHVTPIWFVLDGDDIMLNTGAGTVKGKALRRDPRVCLSVDDQKPPFSFVVIDGVAELSEDVGELRRWATAIGGRYMGADRAEEFGARNAVPGELLVRIRPSRVIAQAEISGSAR
jgi:PPOX class probable F420-dependent enzyme